MDENSLVSRLASNGGHLLSSSGRCAELWVGSHPSGCARLYDQPEKFLEKELPYILKVLSIQHALSVQVHPSRRVARKLHRKKPTEYPDCNHKAEIAIPLTDFEALGGLRPFEEIIDILHRFPELENVTSFVELLDVSQPTINSIIDRLQNDKAECSEEIPIPEFCSQHSAFKTDSADLQMVDQLIIRLHKQYPYDVGTLTPIFLRYHQLKPGQAIYIPPGCPHTYLSGEIVEVMSSSDNVIRCGLTSEVIDKKALKKALQPDSHCIIYDRPQMYRVNGEFIIRKIQGGDLQYLLTKRSLLLSLEDGTAFYVKQTHSSKIGNGQHVLVMPLNMRRKRESLKNLWDYIDKLSEKNAGRLLRFSKG